jgi:hypothetical protein
MTGNNPKGIVAQARDRHLFEVLAILGVIDREQAKQIAPFGSTTRANVRLLALTRAGLLRRFYVGTERGGKKALYALSFRGAALVRVSLHGPRRRQDQVLVADFFVQHQLAINNLYCAVRCQPIPIRDVQAIRWLAFHQSLEGGISLIPDGYFEINSPQGIVASFLEVDMGHEGLKVWKAKIANYLRYALSGHFSKHFEQSRFRVLVVASSERRMHAIRTVAAAATEKIFWFTTVDSISRDGFWSSIWLRPKDDERHSLL